MPEACVIRPASHQDLERMVSLLEKLFSIEEDFSFDRERQRIGLKMMLNNGRGRVIVACVPGPAVAAREIVVGMCTGQLTVSTAEGGPAVLVEDVFVHEDWRGQGIGKRLMREISKWAQVNGAGRLQLLADRENRSAIDFYARLGWKGTRLICLRKRQGSGESSNSLGEA